jgi:uncharacterized SAM-binding protein YcdF (DUF218 family)
VRLVAVLGYSHRRRRELHPVCAARIARAAQEVGPSDTLLLSGWARGGRDASEAELMARAWSGSAHEVLLDESARTTFGNARAVARAAGRVGATEVVLVTSGWHGGRAARLVRAALGDSGGRVSLMATDDRGTLANRLRELACRPLVPAQVAVMSRFDRAPRESC